MLEHAQFIIEDLPLDGLKLLQRKYSLDSRGSFSRLFCIDELKQAGWHKPIAQVNQSVTLRCGTVRGLHYQGAPHAEMKLVSCIKGKVWDVVVDVRTKSPTFLHWHAEVLSAENHKSILIPEGFAHGFQALSDHVIMLYCHNTQHRPDSELGLNARDPKLAILWPQTISMLSARDSQHSFLGPDFKGVFF